MPSRERLLRGKGVISFHYYPISSSKKSHIDLFLYIPFSKELFHIRISLLEWKKGKNIQGEKGAPHKRKYLSFSGYPTKGGKVRKLGELSYTLFSSVLSLPKGSLLLIQPTWHPHKNKKENPSRGHTYRRLKEILVLPYNPPKEEEKSEEDES